MQSTTPFQPSNTKALISMISGIVGWVLNVLFFCFNATFGSLLTLATFGLGLICLLPLSCIPPIGWIVAVIMGHIALSEIKASGQGGRGMAIAGLVMGYLGLGLIVLLILAVVVILLLGGSIPVLEELLRQLNP